MSSIAEQLIEMGFDSSLAEEAAKMNTTMESAMDWIVAKQESGNSGSNCNDSVNTNEGVVGSYKCNDCGKTMKDENAMMFHASKTGHENFAESSESMKPLTEEEKKEQAARLKEKIKDSMRKKDELEEKEKLEREKKRIYEGKMMLENREKQKEKEQLAAIAQRKKDKEEEAEAKKRILEQIRLDKEARKAAQSGVIVSQPIVSHTVPTLTNEKKDYKESTIQIRLPTGEVIRNTFGANEELSAVRLWIEMTKPELIPFTLLQPFPRKVMTDDDMGAPLSVHGLVPSGSLVLTR